MTAPRPARRRQLAATPFLALHLALLAAVLAWAAVRAGTIERDRALPSPRPEPALQKPLNSDPAMVDGERLAAVLARLRLPSAGPPAVATVDHALRLWGAEARFGDPDTLDGEAMRRLLTHHRSFATVYGAVQPLLIDGGERGVRVRVREGPATSSHRDHTLATLAEVGTPLDHGVMTSDRFTDLGELLETSLRDFSLNQREVEWSILAYAHYLPPVRGWVTDEGQAVTFDRMAERLMREDLSAGACSATHRVYTLNALLRVDGRLRETGAEPLLGVATAGRARDFLARVTATLTRHQHPEGFWNGRWPVETPASAEPTGQPGDEEADRLVVTGHALEWWAMAPADLLPPPAVSRAAGRWLARRIEEMSDEEVARNLPFLTHAGLALAHWRGVRPDRLVAADRVAALDTPH